MFKASADYKTEYGDNFYLSISHLSPRSKKSKAASPLPTDRQFLTYWKDSQSHEYHEDPKCYEQVDAAACETNQTSYKSQDNPTFENKLLTTYQESFYTLPYQEKPKLESKKMNLSFDTVEYMKTPRSTHMRDYTLQNTERPESQLRNYPFPIYKDDRFGWLKSESSEKFTNPKIYPPNTESVGLELEIYPTSTNILGQTKNRVLTKDDYCTTKTTWIKNKPAKRLKLVLGDERISKIQWKNSLEHEDFSYIRGSGAVPFNRYPLQLGHPNCAATYDSTVTLDDYKKFDATHRAEINPHFTHHYSEVKIGLPEFASKSSSTYNELFVRWIAGEKSERKVYPKWEMADKTSNI